MQNELPITSWLPITKKEVEKRGWSELDVILISGDAYVDHPSFGIPVIGRVLENKGYKVAIIPQPNWKDDLRDFKKMGKPRLFFGVSSGCMDSMVNHYTANRRLRSNDAYTPGDKSGFRPDYATTVYSNILKELYPDTPVVIGGIEASLRRLTHYDYWSDKLKPGILIESNADMLIYGMGEKPIIELADRLNSGEDISSINDIRQTSYISESLPKTEDKIVLNSHEECLKNKLSYAKNFKHIEEESNKHESQTLIQEYNGSYIVVNPTNLTMSEEALDKVHSLPFTRLPHPKYKKKGAIPAYEMIKFSINLHRGCFGGCSFCTISAHQGKFISSRSENSILKEIEKVKDMPDFKGYLTDLGGPSANMYKMQGIDLEMCYKCRRPSCIYPSVCKNLNNDHKPLSEIYKKVDKLPYIKKATIGSGIRYDMAFEGAKNEEVQKNNIDYLKQVIKRHVSGRLKVAPEHASDKVLKIMRKPSFKLFKKMVKLFEQTNKEAGLKQQLIPYFISSHPASESEDMAELAVETKELNFQLEQVQDFTPTPMTVATVIYYSGYHPYTLKKVKTAKTKDEKLNQRSFFFWYKNEFRQTITKELNKIGRSDLAKRLFTFGKSKGKENTRNTNKSRPDNRRKNDRGKRRR